jgi:ATP-dependent Clp protease, protease subunit
MTMAPPVDGASRFAGTTTGRTGIRALPKCGRGRLRLAPPCAATLPFVKPEIATIGVGIAMSLGALLLAAGTKGKRMALPNAKILIHQLWGGFEGQVTDIEIHAREAIALKRRMEEIIAHHTGQPLETVSKDMERDYFMTAEEAKAYGIIDTVIANRIASG